MLGLPANLCAIWLSLAARVKHQFILLSGRGFESLLGEGLKSVKLVATIVGCADVPAVEAPGIDFDPSNAQFNEELVFSFSPRAFCSRIRGGLKVKVEVSGRPQASCSSCQGFKSCLFFFSFFS